MMDAYTDKLAVIRIRSRSAGKTGSTNYIRNSVKVVVDAYNGDVKFYIVDEEDPIAQTFQKIYPTLFKDF